MSTAKTGRNGIQRMGALACLVAICLGPVKVLPLVLAIAAGVEGSHTVRLEEDGEGSTKLVLGHERGRPGRVDYSPTHNPAYAAHQHGFASRVVCWFAGAANRHADHVACFASGGAFNGGEKEQKARARLDTRHQAPSAALPPAAALLTPPLLALFAQPSHQALTRQRCLRSTCLLI